MLYNWNQALAMIIQLSSGLFEENAGVPLTNLRKSMCPFNPIDLVNQDAMEIKSEYPAA
jgi:hypothetical protein